MARYTPCDSGPCPYGEGGGMYFCRDNCGLGVDDDGPDYEDYEPYDIDDDTGYDPYLGCITNDC